MEQATLSVINAQALTALFGACDQHVRKLRTALGVKISARDGVIHIEGEGAAVAQATAALERLQRLAVRNGVIAPEDVACVLGAISNGEEAVESPPIEVLRAGKKIRPKTLGQARYVEAIRRHEVVFCCGPAGTGKTYLAVATAIAALRREQVKKIVLVRPAVEAGESLGFLPGDLQAKINPYLRPLMDAVREMIDHETLKRYTEEEVIEVIPLAYMRGRTLNESFIILDEAQNTTVSQMKMFLTRMGMGSKIVVSGDITQIDLPEKTRSGLIDALQRLEGIEGIATVKLTRADIVRHPLVQRIVNAYDHPPPRTSKPAARRQDG